MPLTQILDKDLHLLKEIFENSLAPMVITDADLELPGPKFVYVNNAFEKMTGYSKEELKDQTPRILQGPKSDKAMLAKLKETLSKGDFLTGQTVNYTKDGTQYHVEWTISPIKDNSGKVKYFFSIQKDITAQELVKKQQEQMFFEQSRLAAIGEMIDAIAHQFKQPLGIINLKAQQLEFNHMMDGGLDEKQLKTGTQSISDQVTHMSETIDEFRSFFITDKQKQEVIVDDLLNSVHTLIHDDLVSNQIEFHTKGKSQNRVALYPNEFKHLLLNIISNAKDALIQNRNSGRKIWCTIDETASYLKVTVCDNGSGIPESILDKIFTPRFTTKAKGEGSGVGLYLCKKIADKIGAPIKAYNSSEGACFEIKIPL